MANFLAPMLLAAEFRFDPTGPAILFGAVALMVIYVVIKRKREEAAEEETQCAVQPAPAPVPQPCEPAASPAALEKAPEPAKAAPSAPAPVALAADEVALTDVDEATAAMIMAIVCDETGDDPGTLRFRSIRQIKA